MTLPIGAAAEPAELARNHGASLDLDWVLEAEVESAAAQAGVNAVRADPLSETARGADWLLRAIASMDLTTLAGDDTAERVKGLCSRARDPLGPELRAALGHGNRAIRPAAVCIYHHFIPVALRTLEGSGIPVAAVSAGFPHGLSPLPLRIAEIRASVEAGALEIDAVIVRSHVLTGNWQALYDEVRAFREACGDSRLKVILATGELGNPTNIARASRVCMLAGADFIKTSTGKEAENATLPAGVVMAQAIREYRDRSGFSVGLKPAGGIRTGPDVLAWMALVAHQLGSAWLNPALFRVGASSLLDDVVRRLEALVRRNEAGV